MQKTFEELQEIDVMVAELYKKHPELKATKFGYAYSRFYRQNYTPTFDKFQDAIQMVRVNNALEDKTTKEILMDPTNSRGYKYDREGLLKCIEQEREVVIQYYPTLIDIIPYVSQYEPNFLTETQKEMLTGLIF